MEGARSRAEVLALTYYNAPETGSSEPYQVQKGVQESSGERFMPKAAILQEYREVYEKVPGILRRGLPLPDALPNMTEREVRNSLYPSSSLNR